MTARVLKEVAEEMKNGKYICTPCCGLQRSEDIKHTKPKIPTQNANEKF